jgi:hypothetical protein
MYSLVEGMEQHGLKWAKIHKDFKDLDNKTQVQTIGGQNPKPWLPDMYVLQTLNVEAALL